MEIEIGWRLLVAIMWSAFFISAGLHRSRRAENTDDSQCST